MNKISNIHSLKYRMVIALGVSLLIALGTSVLLNTLANYLIWTYYLSPSAIAQRTTEYAGRLSAYVAQGQLRSTDYDALQRWVRQNPYAYMTLYDDTGMIWESGWWDDSVETAISFSTQVQESTAESALDTTQAQTPPVYYFDSLYPVAFSDGSFWVSVTDFSDEPVYRAARAGVTLFSIFLVFPIVLMYARRISRRVIRLTREVDAISSGDLDGNITIQGLDEIALLADGVNTMRLSVIEQLEKEQIAWRANSDLITSMSHDIRTPLTVLLGYTSLLKNKQYTTPEEFDSYVEVIEKKSLQLKELSDKLFRYFLVFGNTVKLQLETVRCSDLLPDLIGEHTVLLTDSGFTFETRWHEDDCMLTVDISYMKRIFDNIFSNIEKYADPKIPCQLISTLIDDKLTLSLSNGVLPDAPQVETTRIGLKTCTRIAQQMGGSFTTHCENNRFTVTLGLPGYR